MGKKKSKKNAFRNGAARAASPGAFILEAVEPTPEFKAGHALEKVKTDQGNYTLRVRDKRPIDKYHRLYLIDEDRGIAERNRRGINERSVPRSPTVWPAITNVPPTIFQPLDMMAWKAASTRHFIRLKASSMQSICIRA